MIKKRLSPFITLEGIDGAGKSTHIPAIYHWMESRGHRWIQTREPGGTPLGEQLRALVLNTPMEADTEALLMFAGRSEHLHQVIWPALEHGDWVISDRFSDASVAYQGAGRALGIERVAELETWTHPGFMPDLTLLFDIDPAIAAERLSKGREARDRFELEQAQFFERVRSAYLARAEAHAQRIVVLNAALPVADVWRAIEAALLQIEARFPL
jgi:dTMP kinase